MSTTFKTQKTCKKTRERKRLAKQCEEATQGRIQSGGFYTEITHVGDQTRLHARRIQGGGAH